MINDKRSIVINAIVRILTIVLKDFDKFEISYTVAYHKPAYVNIFGHNQTQRIIREHEYLQVEMLHSIFDVYEKAQHALYYTFGLVQQPGPHTMSERHQITIPPFGFEGIDFFLDKLSIIEDMDDEALELYIRLKS